MYPNYTKAFLNLEGVFINKKIKNPIIRINAGTLSNMNENTKEIYH